MVVKLNMNSSSKTKSDKPQTKVWMNPGLPIAGTFVGVPFGVPLDTMEEVEVVGKNEDFRQLLRSKNRVLRKFQAIANKLKPGEEKVIMVPMQIRRVEEAIVDDVNDDIEIEEAIDDFEFEEYVPA